MRAQVLLLLLLFALPLAGLAQTYHSSNSFFFLPQVSIERYQGQPYRYQVSVRYVPADTTAHVSLMALQVGKSDYDFKQRDTLAEAVRPNEWQTYTLTGQLGPSTKKIWFYSAIGGNGTFFFDNLTLQVQDANQAWQPVPIKYGDFEHSPTPLAGYETIEKALPTGLVAALAPGQGPDHSQALRLTFSGGILVKNTPPYGHNPAAGHYCQLPGVRLYYETYGRGEPLLLLHGNGESIRSFRKQIEAFWAHFRVIAVDTRAQGQSLDSLTTPLSYELFAADMKALLDSLHIPKAHVVGWSDGGNTGLLMAQHYSTYVQKLVTMGANLFPTTEAVEAKMLRQSEQARQTLLKQGKTASARLLTLVLTEPHLQYADLQTIRVPTLVLAGEKDIIKRAHTQAIAAHIPRAQVVILPGTTHYAPQENPALFNKTVLRFLLEK
ncbi:alpha/beta fold hydrolase [Hymenobacter crusticola]|uniref:alpha/beta fold hydrolase n=1 Tax=Hymenobacter crusticola TaxID=1770526 RepID=UPI000A3C3535|nr:alpha/beta hydrolase [Hymenobacter crusticola]